MENVESSPENITKLTTRRKVGFIARKPKIEASSEDITSLDTANSVSQSTSTSNESYSHEKKTNSNKISNNNNNSNLILPNELAEEANKLFQNDNVQGFSKNKKLKARTMIISRGQITSVIYSKTDDRKNFHILGNSQPSTEDSSDENSYNRNSIHTNSLDNKKSSKMKDLFNSNPSNEIFVPQRQSEYSFLDERYFSSLPLPNKSPNKPPKPPKLPDRKDKPVFSKESKMIIQVRTGGFTKYFKISPQITVKTFLQEILVHIPKLNQFIDHINGKLTLCLPNNQNYVFRDSNEYELFQYLKANSSYFLPMDKTFGSMKHIIKQANHLEILPRSGFFKLNSQHNASKMMVDNSSELTKSIFAPEDPAKIFQFKPMERDNTSTVFLHYSRLSVGMYFAKNILDNTKVKIKKYSLKHEKLDFLMQDVISQNMLKHENLLHLYSVYHRENYAQLWVVVEDFGHSFYDLIRGVCPRTHYWGGSRCSDCLSAQTDEKSESLEDSEDSHEEDVFTSGVRFSEKSISKIIRQVLRALQVIHRNNKVHRNLNSKTIYISKNNVVKIDRFFHPSDEMDEYDRKLILSQHPLPSYIAPELLKYKYIYSPKVDIFSVGIFAMELFEGATPLMELEKSEIFSTLSKMELTYPEKASSKFKSFLSVTLNRNPEKRFSVDELLEHPFIK